MKINFIKTPQINYIAFKQETNSQKPSKLWVEGEDKFVRSTNKADNKPPKETIITKADLDKIFEEHSFAELNRIFEEVYPEVTKFNLNFNPIFQKVKIEKPTIKVEDFINPNMRACYSFIENTISFSKTLLNEDLFLLCIKNKDNKISSNFGFHPESQVEEEKEKLKKEKGEICSIKLTDKEKELYIKALCAHEIRHVFQAHIVASTDSCIEEFKSSLETQADLITILKAQLRKSYNDILESIEKMKASGEEIPEKLMETLAEYAPDEDKDYTYGLTYKPSEILPADSTIKFSVLENDNRKLSVQNDLLPAEITKLLDGNHNNALNYACNLLEIDAFNHAYEYILSHMQFDDKETRKEILYSMALESRKNSTLGIDILELLKKLPETMKK